jgi:hypothetical protein
VTPRRRLKLPTSVLERAKEATGAVKKPLPPPAPMKTAAVSSKRAKVIAALKKLHPMD